MSNTPVQIGDNPQQPSAVFETFIPDQLIAGNLKLVTEGMALITGGLNLLRGTVLGKVMEGTAISSTGKTYATGSVVVAAVPASGDTLTIGGTAITFITPPGSWNDEPPAGNNVYIGTTAQTAQNLAAFLNSSSDANLIKFGYALNAETVTMTAKVIGTGGNALTLATSDSGAFTISGATLSGGTANTGNATVGSISNGIATKVGNYSAVCLTTTTAQVYDPNGAELGVTTFGTAFASPQINFTITAGGTPCAAGDTFVLAATPGSGSYKLAVASATDGSQNPVGILADYAAAAAGDVNGGVYLMGEFNVNAIVLDPSISPAAAKAALRPLGIFLKGSVSADDPAGE